MPAIAGIIGRSDEAAVSRMRAAMKHRGHIDVSPRMTLERDPLGHRPLYFSRLHDGRVVYATELRAILASGLLREPKIEPVGLASAVWNGFVMSPATMVRGVESVLPGQRITFDAGGRELSREFVWSIPRSVAQKTTDESELRDALHDAVKRSLETNDRLGLFLSGGIDSSSIVNIASKYASGIETFCMAMEEASLDESEAAAAIAKAIGTKHHTIRLSERDFVDRLDAAIESLDQPTFDALNQYHVCRALADAGIKTAVGGIGGDAIFGGDKTLRQLPKLRRVARWSQMIPFCVALARAVAPKHSQQKWAKLPDVLKSNGDLLSLYQLTYALFRPDFYEQLVDGIRDGLPDSTRAWLSSEIAGHDAIETAAILETRCFVGERLLRDADTVCASLSMELRSPLSDARIIEAINRLPVGQKFMPVGFKPLLRRHGLAGLDPKLFDRPKSGFVLPFDRWIRKNLGTVMDSCMRDEASLAAIGLKPKAVATLWDDYRRGVPGIYWTRVWAIYVITRWCQRYGLRV